MAALSCSGYKPGAAQQANYKSGTTFEGARFGILAANVVVRETGKLLPAYGIKTSARSESRSWAQP